MVLSRTYVLAVDIGVDPAESQGVHTKPGTHVGKVSIVTGRYGRRRRLSSSIPDHYAGSYTASTINFRRSPHDGRYDPLTGR